MNGEPDVSLVSREPDESTLSGEPDGSLVSREPDKSRTSGELVEARQTEGESSERAVGSVGTKAGMADMTTGEITISVD